MRLFDNFSAPMPLLKELSAVQVNAQILKANRTDNIVAINSLEIPLSLKAMLEALVNPMTYWLSHWHKHTHHKYNPVFAPDGSLDMKMSTRVLMEDETVDIYTRCLVATTYCHEDYVFKLFPKLTGSRPMLDNAFSFRELLRTHGSLLWGLWSDIILALCDVEGPNLVVLEHLYSKGLCYARDLSNDTALRYFINKASISTVTDFFVDDRYLCKFKPNNSSFKPATYCLLFSKLNDKEKKDGKCYFRLFMVNYLMNWEYRWLFEESTGNFIDELSPGEYWMLLEGVLRNAFIHKCPEEERLVLILWRLGGTKQHDLVDSEMKFLIKKIEYMQYVRRAYRKVLDVNIDGSCHSGVLEVSTSVRKAPKRSF